MMAVRKNKKRPAMKRNPSAAELREVYKEAVKLDSAGGKKFNEAGAAYNKLFASEEGSAEAKKWNAEWKRLEAEGVELKKKARAKFEYYERLKAQENPRYLITAKQKQVRDVDLGVFEDRTAAKALGRAKTIYKGYTGMTARKRNSAKSTTGKIFKTVKSATKIVLGAGSTLLGKASKAINPTKRIKVSNKYIDLIIKGTAQKTMGGWLVAGKKTGARGRGKVFPQGKGTTKISSNLYLDKATGAVYAKRERNSKKNPEYRVSVSLKKGIATNKSSTVKALTHGGAVRKAKRSMGRRKALYDYSVQKNPTPAMLALVNPKAGKQREEFTGSYKRDTPLYFPEGTPRGISKLGKLLKIRTELATVKPTKGQTWLCRDLGGKLHLGTTNKTGVIWDGPPESFGKVKRVEYEDVKKHLGYDHLTQFYHFMGEEDGRQPTLYADGKGGLRFKGGNYKITPDGIVN